jgi:hypothetical protein
MRSLQILGQHRSLSRDSFRKALWKIARCIRRGTTMIRRPSRAAATGGGFLSQGALRLMPSFFIRWRKVPGFNPSRTAAP